MALTEPLDVSYLFLQVFENTDCPCLWWILMRWKMFFVYEVLV